MTFQDYSKIIVRDFLGSVAFIDDRIFTSDSAKPSMPPAKEDVVAFSRALSAEGLVNSSSSSAVVSKAELVSPEQSAGVVIKTKDIDIDPKEFMYAFTKEGIHCSLCEYDKKEIGSYNKLLLKSDVAILDWNMNSGEPEGTEACELIEKLLAEDKESSLRMIVIYSSTPKTQWSEILDKKIKPLFGSRKTEITAEYSIISGLTKVVFVHKGDPTILPSRVIDEFAKMTSGLVSNTALNAISLIRKNTNKILGSYHKELDPAYLTNCIYLVDRKSKPELSEYLIKDMIMGSIFDLIHNSHLKETCGKESVNQWMDSVSQYKKSKIKINSIELDLEIEERKSWFNEGYKAFSKKIIDRSCVKKNPQMIDGKIVKENPIDYFTPQNNKRDFINEEFAILSHQKSNYLGHKHNPILTFGCVLKYKQKIVNKNPDSEEFIDQYLLCVQQPCDCLRLKSQEKRRFIFIELDENLDAEKTRIIIKSPDKTYKKLAPKINSFNLKIYEFTETNDGIVQAEDQKFVSADGVEFEWLCDLKSNHAQRIINEFSAYISRVGLDEPEWLRLS